MPTKAIEFLRASAMACSLSLVPRTSIACCWGGSTAGPSHSDVPRQAHSARLPISTGTHREVLALMVRAEEKAGPEDVGEQALMRGLDTAFPCFRLGLSRSKSGRRSRIGHVESSGVPLPWSRPHCCTIDLMSSVGCPYFVI